MILYFPIEHKEIVKFALPKIEMCFDGWFDPPTHSLEVEDDVLRISVDTKSDEPSVHGEIAEITYAFLKGAVVGLTYKDEMGTNPR